MLSTGTGLAPFMSVIKDPETYEHFEKVCAGPRPAREIFRVGLRSGHYRRIAAKTNSSVIKCAIKLVYYYPTVTREPFSQPGSRHHPDGLGKIACRILACLRWTWKRDRVMIWRQS